MDRDFASAVWVDNHDKLSGVVSRLFHQFAHVFRRLNAIEYDAPWRNLRR